MLRLNSNDGEQWSRKKCHEGTRVLGYLFGSLAIFQSWNPKRRARDFIDAAGYSFVSAVICLSVWSMMIKRRYQKGTVRSAIYGGRSLSTGPFSRGCILCAVPKGL